MRELRLILKDQLAIWHGFPDIVQIQVNNDCNTIFNLIAFKFFRAYSSRKPQIFCLIVGSHCLAVSQIPGILSKEIMADSWPF